MKKTVLLALAILTSAVSWAADTLIKNGTKVWSDRNYIIKDMPENLKLTNPMPVQKCSGFAIKFPANTSKALIALYDGPDAAAMLQNKSLKLKPLKLGFNIGIARKNKNLFYKLYIIENPPVVLDCRSTKAGAILLAVNDDVPVIEDTAAEAVVMPEVKKLIKVPGQEYRFQPGKREFEVYVKYPAKGINSNTGFMLVSHNWGGTWKYTQPWCDLLSDRFNLICLSVNYLQSGEAKHDKVPYDHGLLQAVDCLRALYVVQLELDRKNIKFNRQRYYAAGASGGGNVSLMVNKLAPSTFSCIVDLCGMPGLTNDIAFGRGKLNAGYSKDPSSHKYLTAAMQEIRDPGNAAHLQIIRKYNPRNKVVIVHGLDDRSCNPADKMLIAAAMVRAGFRPDTHFLTANDVDGKIVRDTRHSIGNRPEVISKFGFNYLAENGKFAAVISGKSDFDARHEVVYPVTGGKYVVSFKDMPTIRFEK